MRKEIRKVKRKNEGENSKIITRNKRKEEVITMRFKKEKEMEDEGKLTL